MWLALGAAALLPYIAGLNHAWVYDDHGVIVENPFLSDPTAWSRLLTLQTLRDAGVVDGQRPVVVASYLIDRTVWGLDPAGFRITNLSLHVAAVLLVFSLLLRMTEARTAFAAALLFAVHPLAVEAVISPAFREDLLYMVFGLLFLGAFWSKRCTMAMSLAGMAALFLSMLSKEAAVVFPVLLLAGWMFFPALRPPRRVMAVRAVMALLVVVVLAAVIIAGRPVQATGGSWNGISFRGLEGLWSAPWLLVSLLVKMVVPYPLSIDYVLDPVTGAADPRCWMSVAVLVVLVAVSWWKSGLVVRFGWVWLLLLFGPVSNLVPLFNPVADRYAYGILPGFTLIFAGVIIARRRVWGWVPGLCAIMWLILAVVRVHDWKNDRSLWSSALTVEPRSARAYTWLGLLEKEEGNRDNAWRYFEMAERLNPHEPSAKINRAIMLGEQGDLDGAEKLLREVLAVRPDHAAAQGNLAYCLELKAGGRQELPSPDGIHH